jgi:hypothetical protein
MILLAGIASAATVAVLDFDGYGVSFTDASTATQGVRDAFLEGGTLDPLSGSDIADGVSRGQDDALRRARDRVAEARRLYAAGDAAGALAPLAEAIELHEGAFSDVGRRPELADATFLYAQCLLKAGRTTDARAHISAAAALVPDYARERGTRMSSEAAAMLASAEEALAKGPKRARTAGEIGRIAESLSVDYVVTGWVSVDGTVSARLYAGDALVAEARTTLEERPPSPIDPAYAALVARLGEGGAARPEPDPSDALPEDEREALDADEIVDLDEPDARTSGGRDPTVRATSGRPTKTTEKVQIRGGGPIVAPRPVVERWWFWTGAIAVAGGGAFGLWYALTPPPVEYREEPDSWSVTVTTPPEE